ncbi:hypothetical protein HMPREF1383_02541 [Enterococcus faecium V689]|nr:hypothetical protein HMPREF9524_03207 [Enterococcus faecium TX0133a01]EFR70384.1 hypothetical protein HMPREF9526_02597 [Enterococcus faecium TX0133B]EFR73196.1 hypothetical protein HMPREF9523_02912 [Enterococcus faecium TX0133A]EJX38053.1 hypothetical protein HMPREF1383_02541 [Enterococcus faecium V689]EJX74035.1 hypothetical protein HMPREF1372_02386 [Enterococcus faecium P1139]EJY35525.1 hypothetical protein HMPREF1350_03069 [Enterococcus faecium 509]EJY35626.1 hypothetical protein HMPREF
MTKATEFLIKEYTCKPKQRYLLLTKLSPLFLRFLMFSKAMLVFIALGQNIDTIVDVSIMMYTANRTSPFSNCE